MICFPTISNPKQGCKIGFYHMWKNCYLLVSFLTSSPSSIHVYRHSATLFLYVTISGSPKILLQKYSVSGFLSFLHFYAGTMARVSDVLSFSLAVVVFHFSDYFKIRIMFHQNI